MIERHAANKSKKWCTHGTYLCLVLAIHMIHPLMKIHSPPHSNFTFFSIFIFFFQILFMFFVWEWVRKSMGETPLVHQRIKSKKRKFNLIDNLTFPHLINATVYITTIKAISRPPLNHKGRYDMNKSHMQTEGATRDVPCGHQHEIIQLKSNIRG